MGQSRLPEIEPAPDVVGIHGMFKGGYPTLAPELSIEVLSPDDKFVLKAADTSISLPALFEQVDRKLEQTTLDWLARLQNAALAQCSCDTCVSAKTLPFR